MLNRKLLIEYGEKLRKLAIRDKKSIAIAFIDLDNFKTVNDQFGHDIGDRCLCEVAHLLTTNLRKSDIVARVGGDEFIICFYDVEKSAHLEKILDQLLSQISSIRSIDDHLIDIGASIGATITYTPEHVTINKMINIADKLMYKVKHSSKNAVVINEINKK